MPILTLGQIIDALARAEPNRLVGAEETEQVEFKLAPYMLDNDQQKWELAKDVAAFANKRGGVIVIGVESRREPNEIRESALAIRPVRKALVDLQQYRGVIDRWIYPRPEGVDLRWYPPAPTESSGVLVIDVPPQEEGLVPFIVRDMRDPEVQFKGSVGIPRRDGERVVWDTAPELHSQILRGRGRSWSVGPTRGDPLVRATERVDESERLQGWETEPVYFLQALPPQGPETLPGFYDTIQNDLVNHRVLRHAGFAHRWRAQTEALEGGWVSRTSDGLTWLDSDGFLTQGLLVSEDTPLGWHYNRNRAAGSPLILHPVAVVETTLEFFRLLYSLIRPVAGRGSWRYRVLCQRFRSAHVVLPAGGPDLGFAPRVTGGDALASSDKWDRMFDDADDPDRAAFEALQRFYALFGHPPASIPLVENNAVSETQLAALGG